MRKGSILRETEKLHEYIIFAGKERKEAGERRKEGGRKESLQRTGTDTESNRYTKRLRET